MATGMSELTAKLVFRHIGCIPFVRPCANDTDQVRW
jgi:hypothetical protein